MRTVAALSLERQRLDDYKKVVDSSEPNVVFDTFLSGTTGGVSLFIQQWVNALQIWFGGWILNKYPNKYELKDFLIANFAILFSTFGLGGAFQDISDRKEVEKSAGRIFYLLDRESKIDPLSTSGLNLDGKVISSTDFIVKKEEAAVECSPVTTPSPSMARSTDKDVDEEEVYA
jgi:ATP-binding cassette, subfamily B (MDR/TAP), member 1